MKTTLPQSSGHTTIKPIADRKEQPRMQYVITLTLYEHLQAFKRVGLKIPDRESVRTSEMEILKKIKTGFRGTDVDIIKIQFDEQCDKIITAMNEIHRKHPDAIVLSSTPLITHETNGVCVHVTRLIDNKGHLLSIGARSGQQTVERQLDVLRDRLHNRQVIIVDDGSFTGGTLIYLLKLLRAQGAHVIAIVLGILFPTAAKKLAHVFKETLVCVEHLSNPLDWMPLHDFVPFIPNSGKVIGTRLGTAAIPFYLQNGATLSVPYVLPYGKPCEWGGLSFSENDLVLFSRQCLIESMNLFTEMERLNRRQIKIGDVIKTTPSTSIPVSVNQERFDQNDLEDRVIDVINRDYERIRD